MSNRGSATVRYKLHIVFRHLVVNCCRLVATVNAYKIWNVTVGERKWPVYMLISSLALFMYKTFQH